MSTPGKDNPEPPRSFPKKTWLAFALRIANSRKGMSRTLPRSQTSVDDR